jgi:hypothetical protein
MRRWLRRQPTPLLKKVCRFFVKTFLTEALAAPAAIADVKESLFKNLIH